MDKRKNNTQKYTCNEYREEMILIGLKKLLEKEDLSPKERIEIEEKIRELEEKMGL